MEHEHHHYRLMEQQQQQQKRQETDQMYVLDLSLKNKNNKGGSSDVETTTREMDDDDVKMKSTNHHPLESLLSLNGIDKPMYTSNDMTLFWNMLMHFSYNNYFNQQLKDTSAFEGLKGRF